MAASSIWQMTAAERINAAIFIQHTTVRPFIFMGSCFKCFFCLQYYSDIIDLLNHTVSHEVKDRETILSKNIPKGKRTLQVDISELKCRLCNQRQTNLDAIRKHLIDVHYIDFSKASNGMTEYKMEVENGLLSCHLCMKTFHTFTLLNSHMNAHVGKVVCENCGAGFLNQHLLMKHRETHLKNKICCKQCDRVFYKSSQLKYHMEITHKGRDRVKPKKCPQCSEIFKEHYSKMVHLKEVHGIIKSFSCHVCKKTFSTRRALTEHITRLHTEKFKCEICSKCFGIESKLKHHLRAHSGERSFICTICKNAYMHMMSLRKHMRSHNSFKFICSKCGAGFCAKNEFSKHMDWHISCDMQN